jgi:hypothetical protein
MNLLDALGVSPQGVLWAAAAGLVTAVLWAAAVSWRRSRAEQKSGLGLHDGKP